MARRESEPMHRQGSYLRRRHGVFPSPAERLLHPRSRWPAARSIAAVTFAARDVVEIPGRRRRQAQKHGGLWYRGRTKDGIFASSASHASGRRIFAGRFSRLRKFWTVIAQGSFGFVRTKAEK